MPAPKLTVQQILDKANETFRAAESGLFDFLDGGPFRKETGFKNLDVYGRALTNVLQNLREKVPEFDEWYQPYVAEMNNPLMKYFYGLRSQILKEGDPELILQTHIINLNLPDDILPSRPEGAKMYGIGGLGVYWIIEHEDGSIEKRFVEVPTSAIDSKAVSTAGELPTMHLGKPIIDDNSIENLSKLYISYLRRLKESASKKFWK